MLLGCLLVCCGAPPRAELAAPTPTEEQADTAVGTDRRLVQRLDGVLNDLAQHVRATKDAPAPRRVARYPVRLARFRNAGATADDAFNAYRDRVLRVMVQLARRHGLNLHDEAGSDDATELRIVVFDLPESAEAGSERWLMRLAAVGRDHAGRREVIWSDQVALPGP